MVMKRALCSATLLLALAAPVSSTPEIPTEFFEAQNLADAQGRFMSRRAHYEESFRSWMAEHGMTFGTKGEFERRLRIFAANSDLIETHNTANDGSTFTLGHNAFSHLSWEEFKESHLGYKRSSEKSAPAPQAPKPVAAPVEKVAAGRRRLVQVEEDDLPSEVDWVADGAVTPVQNQGMCGSCWAFSAIGAMEGAYYMATKTLAKFSEEQLVDCDKTDHGCFGGDMGQAFDWIKENGGLCTEEDYPYAGLWPPFKTCTTTCTLVEGTEVKEWAQVDATDEALMEAIATVGPIAIAIEADQTAFQFYSSGVFTAPCGAKLDHGVLAVGYGTWEDGTDFWKVKNSWGETWGQEGYILLERSDSEEDAGGECGLLMEATYPILEPIPAPDTADEALYEVIGLEAMERPVGFESSATANDCGGGTSDVVFDDVSVSPTAPVRNEPVSMVAKGTLTKPLAEGAYHLEVKLGSSVVFKHDGSLCGESTAKLPLGLGYIEIHGLPCPAVPGPVEFAVDLTLPSIAPPGEYEVYLTGSEATSHLGDQAVAATATALCVDVKLEL
eukprot:g11454.t1